MWFQKAALIAVALIAPSAIGCPYIARMNELKNEGHDDETIHRKLTSEYWDRSALPDTHYKNQHYTIRQEKGKCGPPHNCYGQIFPEAPSCHFDLEKFIEMGLPFAQTDGSPPYMMDDFFPFGANPNNPTSWQVIQKRDAMGLEFPTNAQLGQIRQSNDDRGPAGYTYLGQLLSHDVNKDKDTKFGQMHHANDIKSSVSPKLDLDTIYGFEDDCNTYLQRDVDPDSDLRYLFPFTAATSCQSSDEPCDIPRHRTGFPVYWPDDRNDNNWILNSITRVWMKLHNKLFMKFRAENPLASNLEIFKKAKIETQRMWQSVALNDILRNFVKGSVLDDVLAGDCKFYCEGTKAYDDKRTPVEFSTCLYRIFHSRIAAAYRMKASGRGSFWSVFTENQEGVNQSFQGGRELDNMDPVFCQFPMHFFFSHDHPLRNKQHILDPMYVSPIHKMPLKVPGNPPGIQEICTSEYSWANCIMSGGEDCDPDHCFALDRNQDNGEVWGSLSFADLARAQVHGVGCGISLAEEAAKVDDKVTVYDISDFKKTAYGLPHALRHDKDLPCLFYFMFESLIQEHGLVLGYLGSRLVAETIKGFVEHTKNNYLDDPNWKSVTGKRDLTFLEVVEWLDSDCFKYDDEEP